MDLLFVLIIILTIILIFYCNVNNNNSNAKSLIMALPLLGVMQYMNTQNQTYYLNEYKYLQNKGIIGSNDSIKPLEDENKQIIQIISEYDSMINLEEQFKKMDNNDKLFDNLNKYFMFKNTNTISDPKILKVSSKQYKRLIIEDLKKFIINKFPKDNKLKDLSDPKNTIDNYFNNFNTDTHKNKSRGDKDYIKKLNRDKDIINCIELEKIININEFNGKESVQRAVSNIIAYIAINKSNNSMTNLLDKYNKYEKYIGKYNKYLYSSDNFLFNNLLTNEINIKGRKKQIYYQRIIRKNIKNSDNIKNIKFNDIKTNLETIINSLATSKPDDTNIISVNNYIYQLFILYNLNLNKINNLKNINVTKEQFNKSLDELKKKIKEKEDNKNIFNSVLTELLESKQPTQNISTDLLNEIKKFDKMKLNQKLQEAQDHFDKTYENSNIVDEILIIQKLIKKYNKLKGIYIDMSYCIYLLSQSDIKNDKKLKICFKPIIDANTLSFRDIIKKLNYEEIEKLKENIASELNKDLINYHFASSNKNITYTDVEMKELKTHYTASTKEDLINREKEIEKKLKPFYLNILVEKYNVKISKLNILIEDNKQLIEDNNKLSVLNELKVLQSFVIKNNYTEYIKSIECIDEKIVTIDIINENIRLLNGQLKAKELEYKIITGEIEELNTAIEQIDQGDVKTILETCIEDMVDIVSYNNLEEQKKTLEEQKQQIQADIKKLNIAATSDALKDQQPQYTGRASGDLEYKLIQNENKLEEIEFNTRMKKLKNSNNSGNNSSSIYEIVEYYIQRQTELENSINQDKNPINLEKCKYDLLKTQERLDEIYMYFEETLNTTTNSRDVSDPKIKFKKQIAELEKNINNNINVQLNQNLKNALERLLSLLDARSQKGFGSFGILNTLEKSKSGMISTEASTEATSTEATTASTIINAKSTTTNTDSKAKSKENDIVSSTPISITGPPETTPVESTITTTASPITSPISSIAQNPDDAIKIGENVIIYTNEDNDKIKKYNDTIDNMNLSILEMIKSTDPNFEKYISDKLKYSYLKLYKDHINIKEKFKFNKAEFSNVDGYLLHRDILDIISDKEINIIKNTFKQLDAYKKGKDLYNHVLDINIFKITREEFKTPLKGHKSKESTLDSILNSILNFSGRKDNDKNIYKKEIEGIINICQQNVLNNKKIDALLNDNNFISKEFKEFFNSLKVNIFSDLNSINKEFLKLQNIYNTTNLKCSYFAKIKDTNSGELGDFNILYNNSNIKNLKDLRTELIKSYNKIEGSTTDDKKDKNLYLTNLCNVTMINNLICFSNIANNLNIKLFELYLSNLKRKEIYKVIAPFEEYVNIDINELKTKIKELELQKQDNENRIPVLEQELQTAQSKLEDCTKKCKIELDKANNEITTLKNTISTNELEIKNLNEKISSHNALIESYKLQIDELNKTIILLKNQIAQITQKNQELENNYNKLSQEKLLLSEELEKIKNELNNSSSTNNSTNEELQTIKTQLNMVNEKLKKCDESYTNNKKFNAECKKKLKETEKNLNNTTEELKETKDKLEILEKEKAQGDAKIKELQGQLDDINKANINIVDKLKKKRQKPNNN